MSGWIKLHRELMEKPIWQCSSIEQKVILITLLTMANHNKRTWEWGGEKYNINPGQFITSLESISQRCGKGVSIQNIRTAIIRFEKLDFLTSESTNKNRLITIVNWGIYQDYIESSNNDPNNNLTSNQQAPNKQLTTNKKEKNINLTVNWDALLEQFNSITGKRLKVVNDKVKRQVRARLKEGYSKEDIVNAVISCFNDAYHKEHGHKYLTLEFITRADKLEKYSNVDPNFKAAPKQDRL